MKSNEQQMSFADFDALTTRLNTHGVIRSAARKRTVISVVDEPVFDFSAAPLTMTVAADQAGEPVVATAVSAEPPPAAAPVPQPQPAQAVKAMTPAQQARATKRALKLQRRAERELFKLNRAAAFAQLTESKEAPHRDAAQSDRQRRQRILATLPPGMIDATLRQPVNVAAQTVCGQYYYFPPTELAVNRDEMTAEIMAQIVARGVKSRVIAASGNTAENDVYVGVIESTAVLPGHFPVGMRFGLPATGGTCRRHPVSGLRSALVIGNTAAPGPDGASQAASVLEFYSEVRRVAATPVYHQIEVRTGADLALRQKAYQERHFDLDPNTKSEAITTATGRDRASAAQVHEPYREEDRYIGDLDRPDSDETALLDDAERDAHPPFPTRSRRAFTVVRGARADTDIDL